MAQYHGFFVLRCPAESTFPAVEKFVRSGKAEALLNIHPSQTYLHGLRAEQRRLARPVQVRAIRMVSPDGVLSVLLTSMIDVRKFPRHDIIDLYKVAPHPAMRTRVPLLLVGLSALPRRVARGLLPMVQFGVRDGPGRRERVTQLDPGSQTSGARMIPAKWQGGYRHGGSLQC